MHYSIDNSNERRILIVLLGFLSVMVCLEITSLEYFYLATVPILDVRSLTSSKAYTLARDSPSGGGGGGGGSVSGGIDVANNINDGRNIKEKADISSSSSSSSLSSSIRPLEQILNKAGVTVTEDIRKSLPSVEGIEQLYGTKPLILGLEQCEIFQKNVPVGEEFITPAGMFNTGTNLLEQMLRKNCILPHREAKYGKLPRNIGIKYQVPWGKHSPVTWKNEHVAPGFEGLNPDYFFPALVVKDPYTWMDSMCRHKYAANWNHFSTDHCPNLVATTDREKALNRGKDVVEVRVHYRDTKVTYHTSMAHLWNDYYTDWMQTDFPKLVVRFEDLLFHAEEVVTKVCECGRGEMRKGPFRYEVDSAKKGKAHTGSNGLVRSMVKYATLSNRLKSIKPQDLEYAMEHLDKDLMKLYHYTQPNL